MDDRQKNELLGGAAALLSPIEWEEPFPVVLPEAMLCGTPVIGFRRGGLPEGIEDGRTGFVCDTTAEMVAAVGRLGAISRHTCRTRSGAAIQCRDHCGRLRASLSGTVWELTPVREGTWLSVGFGPSGPADVAGRTCFEDRT